MLNFYKYLAEGVPQDTVESMIAYFVRFVPPGDFMGAVLANDLMEAMGRADERNRAAIFPICQALYNEAPLHVCVSPAVMGPVVTEIQQRVMDEGNAICLQPRGSRERVAAWLAARTKFPTWAAKWTLDCEALIVEHRDAFPLVGGGS